MSEKGYTVLIDGYNVINKTAYKNKPLKQARDMLAGALLVTKWPVKISEVLLIFDGSADNMRGQSRMEGNIQVIFARPSADSEMQRLIRNHPDPKRIVMVSDDREIMHTAKSHGSMCRPVSWLINKGNSTRHKGLHESNEKNPLSCSEALKITREMARFWNV